VNTDVLYHTYIYDNYVYGRQRFGSTSGCGGLQVLMWNYYGNYSGKMHYWHVEAYAGVIGSQWVYDWFVPGTSMHYRSVAKLLAAGADGCISTGAHLHQAVYESGGATPYKEGDLNSFPMYFR